MLSLLTFVEGAVPPQVAGSDQLPSVTAVKASNLPADNVVNTRTKSPDFSKHVFIC
ncbi:hypothetical protein D3C86_2130220 [compost metagenome]